MADRTDSFLREVDEEVRREQVTRMFDTYGIVIAVAVIAMFIGTGVYLWMKSSRITDQERAGARFEAAASLATEGKSDEALKAFADIAKSAPTGYQSLARLRIAGADANAGRVAEALAAYEALSADSASDQILRDFAALQAAMLRLDQADWTEMQNRLTPLTEDLRPWHAPAREALGLAAFKAGKFDEATKLYEQILGDRATTSGLSRRAQEMLAVLADAASAKGSAAKADAAKDSTVAKPEAGAKGDAGTKK